MNRIAEILRQFGLVGNLVAVERTGSGHINDTYLVQLMQGDELARIILQRINHAVFRDPRSLMDNICRVSDHLRVKFTTSGAEAPQRRVLQVLRTPEGRAWVQDQDNAWWRAFPYIEGTCSHDQLENGAQAYEAARAFGQFSALLADLPGPPLTETIPHFHDGDVRLAQFERALAQDAQRRAQQASAEIAFLRTHAPMLQTLPRLLREGQIQSCVTHNDTKINNVLFDQQSGEGLCVIDLDTVMQGSLLYDFGDLVRSTVGTLAEDADNPQAQSLRPDIFAGLVRGYMAGAGSSLVPAERQLLVFSAQVMSLLIGCRFLTDYLNGDVYFRVDHPQHNLMRCRVQFRLAQLLIDAQAELEQIVAKAWQSTSIGPQRTI